MKGIFWPMNGLQYHSETKERQGFSVNIPWKRRKEVDWSYFHFCWFGNAFLWCGTQISPEDCARSFIIKVNPVEIWPNSTITIAIPPASASLFITIMRISIPGTKSEIPVKTEGIRGHSLICFKTNKKRKESALGSCWRLRSVKLDVCDKTNKRTNRQNKTKKKQQQSKQKTSRTRLNLCSSYMLLRWNRYLLAYKSWTFNWLTILFDEVGKLKVSKLDS